MGTRWSVTVWHALSDFEARGIPGPGEWGAPGGFRHRHDRDGRNRVILRPPRRPSVIGTVGSRSVVGAIVSPDASWDFCRRVTCPQSCGPSGYKDKMGAAHVGFLVEPGGLGGRSTGKGRDLGRSGGSAGPLPLDLHQLPDMSHYNFCWPVRTLERRDEDGRVRKRSPAMAASLADHLWTMARVDHHACCSICLGHHRRSSINTRPMRSSRAVEPPTPRPG